MTGTPWPLYNCIVILLVQRYTLYTLELNSSPSSRTGLVRQCDFPGAPSFCSSCWNVESIAFLYCIYGGNCSFLIQRLFAGSLTFCRWLIPVFIITATAYCIALYVQVYYFGKECTRTSIRCRTYLRSQRCNDWGKPTDCILLSAPAKSDFFFKSRKYQWLRLNGTTFALRMYLCIHNCIR